jgi:hypothetical protein
MLNRSQHDWLLSRRSRVRLARKYIVVLGITAFAVCVFSHALAQDPVDLNSWTAESYPAVSGFYPGVWTVSPDGYSVLQSVNGQPTLFYSDFLAFNTRFEGKIKVETAGDDDFIGFALGYQPGDPTNPSAEYLLVDWKQGTQWYDFLSPSCPPGRTAYEGLAVSRVFGIPAADEFWGHWNFDGSCSDLSSGLEELQRGITRSSTGWTDLIEYDFKFEFTPTNLKVYVNGTLEIDITDGFSNGRIAFYNFSQENVKYSGFTLTSLVPVDIRPQSCPNPLYVGVKGVVKGVLPLAILGTDDLDVRDIDPETIFLEGVAPVRYAYEDKAEPLIREEPCDCWVNGPDGFEDMVIKFDAQDIVDALGGVEDGEVLQLTLTAELMDGTDIEGYDCVVILAKGGPQTAGLGSPAPRDFALFQNTPNPFRDRTTLIFNLPDLMQTKLTIHDAAGRTVATLVDGELAEGTHSVEWKADVPAGTYFCRLMAGALAASTRMTVIP